MDLFGLVSFLIMGSATLCGLSLLLWLVIMERKPPSARADDGRKTTVARGPQPMGRRPAIQRKAARRAVMPGASQPRARTHGSGRA